MDLSPAPGTDSFVSRPFLNGFLRSRIARGALDRTFRTVSYARRSELGLALGGHFSGVSTLSSPPLLFYHSSSPCPFPLLRARLVGTSWDDVKLTHLRSPIRFRSRARPLSSISGRRCRSQSLGLSLPWAEPPFPCSRIDCPPWTLGSCAMSLSHWTSELPFQTADLRSGRPRAT